MRKWQDLAPPDDPESWYDVDGFWPTQRQSYETADATGTTDVTASGAGAVQAAFSAVRAEGSSNNISYVVDATHIWHVTPTSPADRIGTTVAGNQYKFAQYGDITIIAQGAAKYSGDALVQGGNTIFAAAGSNFADLTGAPDATCITVQSNCVFLGNTSNARDGYSISDVGDYTNWSTGEAVTGRIIDTPGPISAAVPFAGAIFVHKPNAIYRMLYVGGPVKWTVQKVWEGVGAYGKATSFNKACAGATGMLFCGSNLQYYWYDGASPPVHVNPFTTIGFPSHIVYCPDYDIFTVWISNAAYYFSPRSMAWGKFAAPLGASPGTTAPVEGNIDPSPTTTCWGQVTSNKLRKFASQSAATGATYLETSKYGRPDRKTVFSRLTPLLRKRTDLGSESAALSASFFREREDTSAARTESVTESSVRKRFDMSFSDNFARFKVTYTAFDVEVDDFLVKTVPGGEE